MGKLSHVTKVHLKCLFNFSCLINTWHVASPVVTHRPALGHCVTEDLSTEENP